MYASFFGLNELPFNNTPDPRFFFSTPDHEEALASLIYSIGEGRGFVLLTGEVGAGKTLVTRLMLRHFGETIAFACVSNTQLSANDVLHSICMEYDIPVARDATNVECIRSLQDFLLANFAENRPVVLMLDEAQALSLKAFEQIRMIGNLEADDAKLLQIVIVGQPELRERFELDEMRQLRQRIFRSFHLPALTREQTEGYIRHRLGVAGAQHPNIFDGSAVDVIYEYSQGLPRLINTVCDNAMLSAYASDRTWIDGPFVQHALSQMMTVQQGGPIHASPRVAPQGGHQQAPIPQPQIQPGYVPHQQPGHHVAQQIYAQAGYSSELAMNPAQAMEARRDLADLVRKCDDAQARLTDSLVRISQAEERIRPLCEQIVNTEAGLRERLADIESRMVDKLQSVGNRTIKQITSVEDKVMERLDSCGDEIIKKIAGEGDDLLQKLGQMREEATGQFTNAHEKAVKQLVLLRKLTETVKRMLLESKSNVSDTAEMINAVQDAKASAGEILTGLTSQSARAGKLALRFRDVFGKMECRAGQLAAGSASLPNPAKSSDPRERVLRKTRAFSQSVRQSSGIAEEMRELLAAANAARPKMPQFSNVELPSTGTVKSAAERSSELQDRVRNLTEMIDTARAE